MKVLYAFIQLTWGCLQSLLGLILFLFNVRAKHFIYHGAVVTEWKSRSSISLGLFVFVTKDPYFCDKLQDYTKQELSQRLLVHEYGHTIQSLILGPMYLLVMGIPSTVWGFSPKLNKKRKERQISYFSFFTESWANTLGELVTKQISMQNLII